MIDIISINEQHNASYLVQNVKLSMPYPTLFKRLLAALYDSFLVLATIFIATALTMPFTQGDVSAENKIFMSLYLLSVIYIFYGWFWTHGGQTLGMRAWRQQLVSIDGKAVNWQQAFIRFITGLPAWLLLISGILIWMLPEKIELADALLSVPRWSFIVVGLIWVWVNHQPNNWRDKLSGTEIIAT
jgi:uncharacterized RDD family membrane protein YckC